MAVAIRAKALAMLLVRVHREGDCTVLQKFEHALHGLAGKKKFAT